MTLIATSKDQAQDLLAPARAAIKRSPFLKRFVADDSARRMSLNTPYNLEHGLDAESGIKIMAAPCSAKATRGYANILGLLEEYGLYYYELAGSNKSDKSIYTAISPSVADLQNPVTGEPEGLLFIVSTPWTRESHMYELEMQVWDNDVEFKNALILHLPSFWTNPLLTTQQLRQDYTVDPISFRREYEAFYTDQQQQALTKEEIEACRLDIDPNYQWVQPGEDVFMGFDLGLVNDPTSITVVACNALGYARVIHHEVISVEKSPDYIDTAVTRDGRSTLDIKKIASRVDHLWDYWGVRKGGGDQWNSFGLKSHLRSGAHENLDLMEISGTLNDRIARNFLAYINQHNVGIYAGPELWDDRDSILRELLRLQRVEAGAMVQRIKLEAPHVKGMHDDQYSSLSRALFVAQHEISERPPSTVGNVQVARRAHEARARAEALRTQQMASASNGRRVPRLRRH